MLLTIEVNYSYAAANNQWNLFTRYLWQRTQSYM